MSLWIEASAGTGKTYYINQIVQKYIHSRIVILTHTNAAVEELKNRINNVYISTIHSFCYKIIEKIYHYNISESEKKYNLTYSDLINIVQYIPLHDLEIDILILDEAQDTSANQWNIIKKIYKETNAEIFILGDQKQLIYEFNGSSLEIYNEMKEFFSFEKEYLYKSYRHSQAIIDYINQDYPGHITDIENGYVKETNYSVQNIIKKLINIDKSNSVILIDSRDKNYRYLINKLNCRNYISEAQACIKYHLFPYRDEYFPFAAYNFNFNKSEIDIIMKLTYRIAICVKKKKFKLYDGSILDYKLQSKLQDMFNIILNKQINILDYIHSDIKEIYYEYIISHVPDMFIFSQYIMKYYDNFFEYDIKTIHQSKGLEYEKVYFPFYTRNHIFFNASLYQRMKYVAITRAKKYLWINSID